MQRIRCVVVGDGCVGKTSLLETMCMGKFPQEYKDELFEKYETLVELDGKQVLVQPKDTHGGKDHDRPRASRYPGTDVLLICFSLDSPRSLENVRNKWYPEVRFHCASCPIILVGTKMDLRDGQISHKDKKKSQSEGREMAKEIRAVDYFECSALTGHGLKQIFTKAAQAVLAPKLNYHPVRRHCILL